MSNKKVNKVKTPKVVEEISPLDNREVAYFNELGAVSSTWAQAKKQLASYQFAIKKLEAARLDVQKGKVKAPFTVTVIPKVLWGTLPTKKEALARIDEHLKVYKIGIKAIMGQVENKYDQYTETASRATEFMNMRYKEAKIKKVVPDRITGRKEEEELFKADFESLLEKSPEGDKVRKEFKEAKKEAVKRNIKKSKK